MCVSLCNVLILFFFFFFSSTFPSVVQIFSLYLCLQSSIPERNFLPGIPDRGHLLCRQKVKRPQADAARKAEAKRRERGIRTEPARALASSSRIKGNVGSMVQNPGQLIALLTCWGTDKTWVRGRFCGLTLPGNAVCTWAWWLILSTLKQTPWDYSALGEAVHVDAQEAAQRIGCPSNTAETQLLMRMSKRMHRLDM